MSVTELCMKERDTVLPKWVDAFFASYGFNSPGLMRTSADPFANPVGQTTRESLGVLYSAVAGCDTEPDAVRQALDRLIKIRAIQDMTPARAVGALYAVKPLLRKYVLAGTGAKKENVFLQEWLEAESRVDTLALMAFDMYMADRETVYAARVKEVKRSQSQILRLVKRGNPAVGAEEPPE